MILTYIVGESLLLMLPVLGNNHRAWVDVNVGRNESFPWACRKYEPYIQR